MGKFNVGASFERTINHVVDDYAEFLHDKGLLSDEEFEYHTGNESGKIEIFDALLERVYEKEKLKDGRVVPTSSAFAHFCKFIIKDYGGRTVWNRFTKEMFETKIKHQYFAFLASRGLGKSFFQYVLYTSFMMFIYPEYKIVFVANTPIQLTENIRFLKNTIDSNEVLYSKKNSDKGKDLKWTERQIEYNHGMLHSISAGTSPRSLHVHEVIIDDIRPETSQLNDEELIDYTLSQVMPIVQRNKGKLSISGTPIHLRDYYHYFMGTEPDYNGKLITDGGYSHAGFYCRTWPAYDSNDEPFLKEVYDSGQLDRIRKMIGEIRFNREYMLQCTDKSLNVFSEQLIKSCSDVALKYVFAPQPEDEYGNPRDKQRYVIGVDVATSGAASADFSVFTVIQLVKRNKNTQKIVRHIKRTKGMEIAKQIETVKELSEKFNRASVLVEKNNVGVALFEELRNQNVNVNEFTTTKPKKEGMIRYLVTEMENGNMWFPEDSEEIIALKRELLNFGTIRTRAGNERMEALSGHDDMVISLAIANDAAQNTGGLPYIHYM